MTTPTEALARLRRAEESGALTALAERHALALVVVFGSTARGTPSPGDLDVAVSSRAGGIDAVTLVGDLVDLLGFDDVDLLDLDRAGPVARQQALVGGDPIYEFPVGEFAREQMRASGERLSTEWLRRRSLARLADG